MINFAGVDGEVLESSPHGNYLVVGLSDRITICGTFSNQFNWDENPDISSGFTAFITYIGLSSPTELDDFAVFILKHGGYQNPNDSGIRPSKRNLSYPFEIKIRGFSVDSVLLLLNL